MLDDLLIYIGALGLALVFFIGSFLLFSKKIKNHFLFSKNWKILFLSGLILSLNSLAELFDMYRSWAAGISIIIFFIGSFMRDKPME